jgi:N-acetyl-alpha-D-glucosaminyl L-malate synthase BshA
LTDHPLRIGVACFSTFGGSGVIAAEVANALARRGHKVHVFSDERPSRLAIEAGGPIFHAVGSPAYPQLRHSLYAFALASRIIEVSRQERLDIVHAHYALPHAGSARLARQVLAADGDVVPPRIVTTLHGTDITLVGSDPAFLPLVRFSILESDAVTVPSQWLADATRATMDLPAAFRIDVVPNFVDVDRFVPRPPAAPGSAARPPVLLHVSNFRLLKRIGDVVAIFARVRAAGPARLRLVGDGPERAPAVAELTRLGLAGDVDLLGEQVDLPETLADADLFLLPSESESFGLAALEAMACGVPVVASDVGGLPEVLGADDEAGFLRPVGDVDGMAACARRLLDDPDLRRRMAAAARRRAETRFRPEPAIERYLDVYRRAAAG